MEDCVSNGHIEARAQEPEGDDRTQPAIPNPLSEERGVMMTKKKISVFGTYANRGNAEVAVNQLKDAGFPNSNISILLPEKVDGLEGGPIAGEKSTKAPKAATAGARSGAVLGGVLGWPAGVGTFIIPGLGPFLAAGPLFATLFGAGVGSVFGGFAGALIGLGISEDEAKLYEARMLKGGILVAVQCDTQDEVRKAKRFAKANDAVDITVSAGQPPEHAAKVA